MTDFMTNATRDRPSTVNMLGSFGIHHALLSLPEDDRCSPFSTPTLVPGPLYQRLKLVKRGHRGRTEPQVCGVSFESCPVWIWAFRLSDWEAIYVTDTDELRLRQYHSSTWSFVQDRVRIVSINQLPFITEDVGVWFVSGSRKFLQSFVGPALGTPTMIWLEGCGRRRPPDTLERIWFSVSHETVGGSTTARGVFGRSGLEAFQVDIDPLRRSISHILKFSVRPQPCSMPCLENHYVIGQRLSLHRVLQPVVYESGFSRTGWGKRPLTECELAQAFDLPSYIEWDKAFPVTLIPIQVFRVVVDAVLDVLRPKGVERGGARARIAVSTVSPLLLDAQWLDKLKVWLPGSWADIAIADKAVKSDDAIVEQYPWNQRIILVLPRASISAIRGFETFGLSVWYRGLLHSFLAYLAQTYGTEWRRSAAAATWKGDHQGSRSNKRKRSGAKGFKDHDLGGYDEEGRQQLLADTKCGFRILKQVAESSWWEWTGGSSLFFWRWNGMEQIRAARDGIPIFVASPLPKHRRQKPSRLDPSQQLLVAGKLDGMVSRGYLETGFVSNAVHFFAVPKGNSDIRVVFDGTSSGLNETLWSPNFFLPSAKSATMCLCFDTWMADMDFGEMFHNFHMDPRIRPFSGVELGPLTPLVPSIRPANKSTATKPAILRWTRLFMGMRPSPYLAVRHYYWGEEFARGNPATPGNPMGYDCVKLNLPGMKGYDPSKPKVMKWKNSQNETEEGHVAGDVVTFVDDVRVTGYSKSNCWDVYRQLASRVQYLGMQNAPRKFRPPSQTNAGAWTGTIFRIKTDHITKSVTQEKWDKGKEMIGRRLEEIVKGNDYRPWLDRRSLEKETGFLNHLSMTFETMVPFLKGFYLSLNSWREGRDENDWKVTPKRWKALLFARAADGVLTDEQLNHELDRHDPIDAPKLVRASPSLKGDLEALSFMVGSDLAPEVSIRSRKVLTIVYGFGDASGSGLGATFTCGSGFNFRIGIWGSEEDPESSNWKEFTNIVESLEDEAESGNLADSEVYMFTDNSTVESCSAKGSSSSEKLLGLIIRLHGLMTRSGVKIHLFHVAGTRMIAQGTDGVSRGYLGQGVMAGESMVAHIPVHVPANERSPNLVPWIRSWTGDDSILLDEEGWFQSGHDIEGWTKGCDGFERLILSPQGRTYIWSPPPIAAEVAIAELRKARIKRQASCHVFVCPRLCTTQWAKQLYRAADLVFELPVGFSCWPVCMHEPLLIGILFPFLSVNPWQIKGSPKMFAVGRELRKVLQESEVESRNLLRKLWSLGRDLRSVPEHLVRQLLFIR